MRTMIQFSRIFLLIFSAFLLLGCEPKGSQQSVSTKTESFRVWMHGSVAEQQALESIVREFLAQEKSTAQIDVFRFNSESDLRQLLLHEIAEGYAPDVVYTTPAWVIQNINKILPNPNAEGLAKDNLLQIFIPPAVEAMIIDNWVYGIPMYADTLAIVFNRDHLITRLSSTSLPAKTWVGIEKNVAELTQFDEEEKTIKTSAIALGLTENVRDAAHILANLWAVYGGNFESPDGTQIIFFRERLGGGAIPSYNPLENATNFFISFTNKNSKNRTWNVFLADKNTALKNFQTFVNGQVSMIITYSKNLPLIKNLADKSSARIDMGIAPFPSVSADRLLTDMKMLVVPKKSSDPNIAWRFLGFAGDKKAQQIFFEKTNLPTIRLDLMSLQKEKNSDLSVFIDQAKRAQVWRSKNIEDEIFYQDLEKIIQAATKGQNIKKLISGLGTRYQIFVDQKNKIQATRPKKSEE